MKWTVAVEVLALCCYANCLGISGNRNGQTKARESSDEVKDLGDKELTPENDNLKVSPETVLATKGFIDALKSAENMSTSQNMALEAMSKWDGKHSDKLDPQNVVELSKSKLGIFPEWYHVFPTYFVPDSIVQQVKAAVENGTYDAKNPVLFGPEESEDGAAYFREDAQMSSMFYNWHLNFASLMEPSTVNNSWEGRGEMYYDFHNQLAVAYNLRTAKGDWLLDWDKPIKLGYRADLVNSSGQKLSSRSSDHPPTDNGYFQEVMDIRQKFQAVRKTNSIYINESDSARLPEGSDKVTSLLADLLYNTTDSLNPAYYKSYYDAALEYVASLGSNPGQDAGGAVRYPLTALRDPAFYAIAMEVNDIIRHYRKLNTSYAKEDMVLDDVEINSLDVKNLETYFEAFDIGVTRAIENSFEWLKYTVRSLRLNHKPFETVLNITNKGDSPKDVMINIAMARSSPLPTAPVDNYQPFDRFTVQLNQGVNLIRRKSSESKIFVQEPNFVGICGIPERLALPRGSEAGVPLTFMAAVTPYDRMKDTSLEEGGGPGVHHDWELSPICGNRRFTYGKPLGFPFDRTSGDAPLTASYEGTVYHSKRKFSSSITM